MTHRVIVIGGGVIGAFSAHYLLERGTQVVVLDRASFGQGCSHANCGLVCPSHVLPLAVPGAVGKTLRAMFGPQSPLYIKPRLSPALWSWLWKFTRCCKHDRMITTGVARLSLLESSMQLYRELMKSSSVDIEWEDNGCLMVHLDEHEFAAYEKTNELISEHFGISAEPLQGEKLRELEPALVDGLAGAWHYRSDAHLRPDRLMSFLKSSLQAAGGEVRDNTEVAGLIVQNGHCRGVSTTAGESIDGDHVVIATGAMTPLLQRQLGCKIPIQPGKGYSITTSRPSTCPRLPLLFEAHKVVATPMQSGYRLGSTMEFAGYDTSLNRRRLEALKSAAVHYLREPYTDLVQEEWYGWRPMTYDGLPIIDATPALSNVWVAAGHNMLGLSMGPATGRLIAELIHGEAPHLDVAPYRITRF